MSEVEAHPTVGEIRAIRTFRIGADGALLPVTDANGPVWVDGSNTAGCRHSQSEDGHAAPDKECGCGIHGYSDVDWTEYDEAHHLLATIDTYGTIVPGDKGVRAAKARLSGLWVSPAIPDTVRWRIRRRYPSATFYSRRRDLVQDQRSGGQADTWQRPPLFLRPGVVRALMAALVVVGAATMVCAALLHRLPLTLAHSVGYITLAGVAAMGAVKVHCLFAPHKTPYFTVQEVGRATLPCIPLGFAALLLVSATPTSTLSPFGQMVAITGGVGTGFMLAAVLRLTRPPTSPTIHRATDVAGLIEAETGDWRVSAPPSLTGGSQHLRLTNGRTSLLLIQPYTYRSRREVRTPAPLAGASTVYDDEFILVDLCDGHVVAIATDRNTETQAMLEDTTPDEVTPQDFVIGDPEPLAETFSRLRVPDHIWHPPSLRSPTTMARPPGTAPHLVMYQPPFNLPTPEMTEEEKTACLDALSRMESMWRQSALDEIDAASIAPASVPAEELRPPMAEAEVAAGWRSLLRRRGVGDEVEQIAHLYLAAGYGEGITARRPSRLRMPTSADPSDANTVWFRVLCLVAHRDSDEVGTLNPVRNAKRGGVDGYSPYTETLFILSAPPATTFG